MAAPLPGKVRREHPGADQNSQARASTFQVRVDKQLHQPDFVPAGNPRKVERQPPRHQTRELPVRQRQIQAVRFLKLCLLGSSDLCIKRKIA